MHLVGMIEQKSGKSRQNQAKISLFPYVDGAFFRKHNALRIGMLFRYKKVYVKFCTKWCNSVKEILNFFLGVVPNSV